MVVVLIFWIFSNLLANTCIIYVTAHIHVWIICGNTGKDKKKHLFSHYEFNSTVAIAFLDLSGLFHNIKKYRELKVL